jgi:uncharacterized repeat protein (TIGR03803 family)
MNMGRLTVTRRRGWIHFCAAFLFCAIAAVASSAQTFTTLVQFDGSQGAYPFKLVQGMNGNLYGTSGGGDSAHLDGTVFEMTPAGLLTTLYTFSGGSDGTRPSGLVLATSGNFYGTTLGIERSCAKVGCGTVFKITPSGGLTTLHTFHSTDGADPHTLALGIDGNLYGATPNGGNIKNCVSNFVAGCGTLYKITPAGQLTTLHVFCLQMPCADGENPGAQLVQASNGLFYGAAPAGGSIKEICGCGTIFQTTTAGTFTVQHTFGVTDGDGPSGLIQGSDGLLYGTTSTVGSIFNISTSGMLTTLFNFNVSDGEFPGGVIQATDGNFYGTTDAGGANGFGNIFELTPAGVFTVLHDFSGTDGQYTNGLIQATDGKFYGTTTGGGIVNCSGYGCGTVFSLDTGLPPFVTFVVKAGKVGKTVEILGQGLTGTKGVSFNGVTATFKVRSDALLTATVPAGATTGLVTVSTPSGTLTSNVTFQILP